MLKVQVSVPKNIWGQSGLTVVELMIATSVFAVITVVASATVVRLTNNFQRSLTQTTTQNANRGIIDDLSQTLQVNGQRYSPITPAADGSQGFCVDGVRFSYKRGQQLIDSNSRAFVKDVLGGDCSGATAQSLSGGGVVGKELLGKNMRLSNLNIVQRGKVFTVTVRVAYGDDDLLNNPTGTNASCKANAGSQFCATSELSTTIKTRL